MGPVQDSALGFIDAATLSQDDILPVDLYLTEQYSLEVNYIVHNPKHRWDVHIGPVTCVMSVGVQHAIYILLPLASRSAVHCTVGLQSCHGSTCCVQMYAHKHACSPCMLTSLVAL